MQDVNQTIGRLAAYYRHPLFQLAKRCSQVIDEADMSHMQLDDENVIDLLADNIAEPIARLRSALKLTKHSRRFRRAAWHT